MIRSRVASAAGLLLLAWGALAVPAALAQTPSPSPSGSGAAPSPSASSAAPSSSPEAATESLSLLLAAEPSTIAVGGETLLVAQVTNTGTTALAAASVTVELPAELELVSSFPEGSASGGTYTIGLGPLDPGESAVAQVTVRGAVAVAGALVSASATAGSATAADSTSVTVVEGGGGSAGLAVSSRTRGVLTQVGSMVRYEVTVANEGDEDLDDVLVVDVAPHEVDVVSVELVDEVEAVQIGESGGRHDIVWNVGSLPAGSSVTLPWDGRAVAAGDLRAVNSVRGLIGTTETTRSSSESFLATEGPRAVDNPHFEPIEERVVTFVDPPAPASAGRAATQPVVLPLTGVSISRIVFAGILLVFAGMLIALGAGLAPRSSHKVIAAAFLAGLVGAACVSGGDDGSVSGAANGATPRTFGTDDPRDDDTQVKGERIVRGDEGDAGDDATAAPASAPPPATAEPSATPPPPVAPATTTPPPVVAAPATDAAPAADPAPIRMVQIVKTGLEDLPVETQSSRAGDNTVSFGWDEAAGGITFASSGTRFTGDEGSELLTDVAADAGAIVNRITLRNTAEATRLRVPGRLVHEVYDGSRLVARLRSAPLDVVLAPGGEVVARFSYLVPAGDYTVHAAFESTD
ncbi:MAG: DUF11 domain-containing protein [Actinomycetota bacterium]|nr:DUF11 domain-containing protein [Actinomycetota bacterium]